MNEKIIRTVDLKNGLRLEALDSSRIVAGNRWPVVLKILKRKSWYSNDQNA